jgi:hypothetical protein
MCEKVVLNSWSQYGSEYAYSPTAINWHKVKNKKQIISLMPKWHTESFILDYSTGVSIEPDAQ